MKTTHEFYTEKYETGQALRNEHGHANALRFDRESVMFASSVEQYGLTTAINIAMTQCTDDALRIEGSEPAHNQSYRCQAERARYRRVHRQTEDAYLTELHRLRKAGAEVDACMRQHPRVGESAIKERARRAVYAQTNRAAFDEGTLVNEFAFKAGFSKETCDMLREKRHAIWANIRDAGYAEVERRYEKRIIRNCADSPAPSYTTRDVEFPRKHASITINLDILFDELFVA